MPMGVVPEPTLPQNGEAEDAELLSAYVRGDERAFESLVKRYFGLVHGIALRRLRDSSLAEEAAQSIFIILARKAKRMSSGMMLRAWLLKTCRFVCNDLLKSLRRRQAHEETVAFDLGEVSASAADDRPAQE